MSLDDKQAFRFCLELSSVTCDCLPSKKKRGTVACINASSV